MYPLTMAPQIVLDGVSFQIDEKDKLGLIGRNGSGKTTLLKVLTGREEPTSGSVVVPQSTTVGYVPQYVDADETVTVREFLLEDYNRVVEELRRAERGLESVGQVRHGSGSRCLPECPRCVRPYGRRAFRR